MAAVLSRNLSDISKITIFLDETRRLGIEVLVPDVNTGIFNFSVTHTGNIRFGLGAVKNVGSNVVQHIIEKRSEGGAFKDIYDFVERVDMHIVNKKNMEGLAYAGALDCFGIERHNYFAPNENGQTLIEQLIKYANRMKEEGNGAQQSLFGDDVEGFEIAKPQITQGPPWARMVRMNKEKEYVGVYLSEHPLDVFRLELNHLCNTHFSDLNQDFDSFENREIVVGGMVTSVEHLYGKNGKPYGRFVIEDYTDEYKVILFGDDYMKYKAYLEPEWSLLIRAKIQRRPWGNQDLEFKISDMMNMLDVRESKIKSINIRVPLQLVNDEFVAELHRMVSKKKGNVQLLFNIYDEARNISIPFFSRSVTIELTNELVNYLDTMPELEYSLN